MLKSNLAKLALRNGNSAFGTMIRAFREPSIISLSASAGWDFLILDAEHCAFNPETVADLCLTASYEDMALLVRVPDKDYHLLSQPLDYGANGLVIPHVEEVEQLRAIEDSTHYFPVGHRGASQASVSLRSPGHTTEEYMRWANRETLLVIQIETRRGVENAESLLSQKIADAVMIGPQDLAQSYGIPGRTDAPEVADACDHVVEMCQKFHVAAGIHLQKISDVERWMKKGMRFIVYQYDFKLFRGAGQEVLRKLKAREQQEDSQ